MELKKSNAFSCSGAQKLGTRVTFTKFVWFALIVLIFRSGKNLDILWRYHGFLFLHLEAATFRDPNGQSKRRWFLFRYFGWGIWKSHSLCSLTLRFQNIQRFIIFRRFFAFLGILELCVLITFYEFWANRRKFSLCYWIHWK